MSESDLQKLSKDQLIDLLLKQQQKPLPKPRKSVKQMAQDYEDNIILPPLEFRDGYKPISAPSKKHKKPVPPPRTIINETAIALKGFTKSYEIVIKSKIDPLIQLQSTQKAIEIGHVVPGVVVCLLLSIIVGRVKKGPQ